MNLTKHIVSSAEHVFDRHGFAATGMDRLTQAAQVSSRTLYKHIGGKTALIASVLATRRERFAAHLAVDSVDALFEALERWTRLEGARGCLFLRAQGEMGDDMPEIAEAVADYRRSLRDLLADVVARDLGGRPSNVLVEQILVLFEGATSAASYLGPEAIRAARQTAAVVMDMAR